MSEQAVVTESVWILSGQVNESEPVRDIPISLFPFQVGRRTDLSFCLASPTVSNLHAEIYDRDEQLYVRDLRSTNGTYINGRRVIEEARIQEGDLIQFANMVFRLKRQDAMVNAATVRGEECDRALALIQFDRLMNERAVVPFFQPIVDSRDASLLGYEILGRSHLYGLKMPSAMFQAASQLNLEAELSRLCRMAGIQSSQVLPGPPHVFVNTHPAELTDISVLELSLQEIREQFPKQQMTLEIHETAVTEPRSMQSIRDMLTELTIGLAYDDFGAGQARLLELCEVPPDYLKFDMKLIRGIDQASGQRQHMLSSLVRMVQDLGVAAVAEGMETGAEARTCRQLGFMFSQGYFYGKPAPVGLHRARYESADSHD